MPAKKLNLPASYQFYVELLDTDPLVWRRLLVPAHYTLYGLHKAIQGAFGWENAHLFQFSEKGFASKMSYGLTGPYIDSDNSTIDADKTPMRLVLNRQGQTYTYIYDFGDDWTHHVTLEEIGDKDLAAPFCLEGAGACPPEDVGGTHGYQLMLEAFATPRHPEKARYREWLGLGPKEKWDAASFNVREVNKRLSLLAR